MVRSFKELRFEVQSSQEHFFSMSLLTQPRPSPCNNKSCIMPSSKTKLPWVEQKKKDFPSKHIICQKVLSTGSSGVHCDIHSLSVALSGRILGVTSAIFMQYLQRFFKSRTDNSLLPRCLQDMNILHFVLLLHFYVTLHTKSKMIPEKSFCVAYSLKT